MNRVPVLRNLILRTLAAAILLTSAIAVPVYAAQGPTDVVKALVNPALQILGDKSASPQDRAQKLKQLITSDVFDFSAMARSALGLHWKDLNDQQRQDFTNTFTAFLRDSYISRIKDYSAQVNFLGETSIGDGRTEVKTNIEQGNGKAPIQVNYSLRQQNGKWLIYDVSVDNISIAANYRNQFNRVINNQGFDTLLADLKRKQQGLEDSLGTARAQ